jgi:hypothetical protein
MIEKTTSSRRRRRRRRKGHPNFELQEEVVEKDIF